MKLTIKPPKSREDRRLAAQEMMYTKADLEATAHIKGILKRIGPVDPEWSEPIEVKQARWRKNLRAIIEKEKADETEK